MCSCWLWKLGHFRGCVPVEYRPYYDACDLYDERRYGPEEKKWSKSKLDLWNTKTCANNRYLCLAYKSKYSFQCVVAEVQTLGFSPNSGPHLRVQATWTKRVNSKNVKHRLWTIPLQIISERSKIVAWSLSVSLQYGASGGVGRWQESPRADVYSRSRPATRRVTCCGRASYVHNNGNSSNNKINLMHKCIVFYTMSMRIYPRQGME